MLAAPESANISLTSASVYVYDFLDRREDVYSSKVLDEFERQLLAWLGAKAKAVTLLRSNQTPFMLATKAGQADDWSASINVDQTTQRVPVMDAIASNAAVEDSFGADHQLIVFPTSFSSTGAWRSYIIRWEVIRKSDRKTWQYMYSGRHMVMWSDNERSESRAKKFVDGVNQAMETDGLLNASPKQP